MKSATTTVLLICCFLMPSLLSSSMFVKSASFGSLEYSTLIGKVFQLYTTRDAQTQWTIIQQNYSPDMTFEDPLMIVHGHKNFRVQFLSLIKFFSNITMDYSLTGSRLYTLKDPGYAGEGSVDVVIPNRQVYRFSREGWLSQKTLPEIVDLNATTVLTVDKQSGMIVRHTDTWEGKQDSWAYQRFGKPTVGRVTSFWFRLLGW